MIQTHDLTVKLLLFNLSWISSLIRYDIVAQLDQMWFRYRFTKLKQLLCAESLVILESRFFSLTASYSSLIEALINYGESSITDFVLYKIHRTTITIYNSLDVQCADFLSANSQ